MNGRCENIAAAQLSQTVASRQHQSNLLQLFISRTRLHAYKRRGVPFPLLVARRSSLVARSAAPQPPRNRLACTPCGLPPTFADENDANETAQDLQTAIEQLQREHRIASETWDNAPALRIQMILGALSFYSRHNSRATAVKLANPRAPVRAQVWTPAISSQSNNNKNIRARLFGTESAYYHRSTNSYFSGNTDPRYWNGSTYIIYLLAMLNWHFSRTLLGWVTDIFGTMKWQFIFHPMYLFLWQVKHEIDLLSTVKRQFLRILLGWVTDCFFKVKESWRLRKSKSINKTRNKCYLVTTIKQHFLRILLRRVTDYFF